MNCRMADMRNKEVINIKDGTRLGSVCDIELDTRNARIYALIIYGKLRLLGLLGREEDLVIRWEDIEVIGDDTILVNYTHIGHPKKRMRLFGSIFGKN